MDNQSEQSYPLTNSERALKLSLSRMRAPQDIMITVLSFGRIKDAKVGGKRVCINCYQGEFGDKHLLSWYTHIFHSRAKAGAHVHVPGVIMRVVRDDNNNSTKATPA
jgi:hypothetical protein